MPNGRSPARSAISDTPKFQFFVAGFVGGILSQLIRPLQEFLTQHKYPSTLTVWFIVFALLLGAIAAFLVWFHKAYEVRLAFTLGLGVPSFIMNLGGAVQNTPEVRPDQPLPKSAIESDGTIGWFPPLISSAYAAAAQEPEIPLTYSLKRTLEIIHVDAAFAYRAELLDSSGRVVESFNTDQPPIPSASTHAIPDAATAVRFTSGSTQSRLNSFAAKPEIIVGVALRGKLERQLGVAQVFGKRPDIRVTEIDAEVESRLKAPSGLEGWIYLGSRNDHSWTFRTIDVPDGDLPEEGADFRISFPCNVRNAMRSKEERLGILSIGQMIRLTSAPQGTGKIWAQIRVIE